MPQAIYAQQGSGNRGGGVGVGIGVGGGALTSLFDSAVKGAGSAIGGGVQSILSEAIMGESPTVVAQNQANAAKRSEMLQNSAGQGQTYDQVRAAFPDLDVSAEEYAVAQQSPGARTASHYRGNLDNALNQSEGKAQYAPVMKETPAQAPAAEPSLTDSLISADGSAPAVDAPQEDMSMAPTQVTPEAFYSPTNDSYQAGPAGGMETGGGVQAGEAAWNVQEHLKGVPQNTILKQVAKEKLINDSMLEGQIAVNWAAYNNVMVAMNNKQQTSMESALATQKALEMVNSFEQTAAAFDQRSMMLGIAPDVWESKPATYLSASYDMNNPQELQNLRDIVLGNRVNWHSLTPEMQQYTENTEKEISEREGNLKSNQAWESSLNGTDLRKLQEFKKSILVSKPAAAKSGYLKSMEVHQKTVAAEAKDATERWKEENKNTRFNQTLAANEGYRAQRLGIKREEVGLKRQTVEGTLRHHENMDARQEKLYQLNVTRTNAELLRKKGEITPRDVFMAGMKSTANHETLLNRSLATLAKEEGDFLRVNPSAPASPERKKQYEAQKAEFKSRRDAINSSMAGVREQQSYLLERAGSAAGSLQSSATSDPVSTFPRTSPEYYEQLGVDFGDMPDQDQVTTSKFIDTMLSRPRTPIKNGPRQPTPEELSSILNNPASVEKLKAMNMGVELTPANVSKILAAYREAYLVDGARK